MRINEFDKQITSSDLEALETFADRIFGKVGIDVEFTRHFLDRVNDERNGKQITASELTRLFKQEYKRWGQPIAQMGPDQEAVMKDLVTDINMPFALRWDRENEELDLIVKTVMRKPDFKTSNKEFPVESASETEDCTGCNGTGWERVSSDEDERACDDCGGTGKVNESGFRMNGPSGLRSTPTQRSTHKTISLPLRGEKPLRPAHSNNMFRKTLKLSKDNKTDNETVNEESQIWKWNKEDPNNPEVLIQGYGRLMLNQIEASVVRKLAELTKMAERGEFEQIQSLLDRDVMQIMMKAVVDTKAELQATRKRGGPKSRGINKESILDIFDDGIEDKFKAVKNSVSETGGVGKIIPGINTTVDVGPNEITKQAAKFGNKVSKDGLPKKTFRRK